jgi:anion-transporting  ArsA/GET3 family ATPase
MSVFGMFSASTGYVHHDVMDDGDDRRGILTPIVDTPLVIVTGKGGTGRTTVAAALGLAAAAEGRRTIVCEVAGQSRVPRLLGAMPAGRHVAPGVEVPIADGLWATTIEPNSALEEWLGRQLPPRLIGPLARSGAFGGFVAAAPGARELVTITKAWELGEARRWRRDAVPYDTVIFDAPASGHGLGLLRTPRTFADIARIGPIAHTARDVDAALLDPARTAIVAVALPGELAVSETLELERWLGERVGRGLDAIVVNSVWPRRITAGDAARVAAADGAVSPALHHAARAASARVRVQQGQLARLRRDAAAHVHTLPFVFSGALAGEQIRTFSTRLAEV